MPSPTETRPRYQPRPEENAAAAERMHWSSLYALRALREAREQAEAAADCFMTEIAMHPPRGGYAEAQKAADLWGEAI